MPIFKKNGKLRLCGDFKVTIDQFIEVDEYPLPKIKDLFCKFRGGSKFTKLDISQAYQQVGVDDVSRELLTVNTHKGLFRYNRLRSGVASAPTMFQKIVESLLGGIDGVIVFLDDILITGKNASEHLPRLKQVLNILQESGLK